jgi:hypothetical protein
MDRRALEAGYMHAGITGAALMDVLEKKQKSNGIEETYLVLSCTDKSFNTELPMQKCIRMPTTCGNL